MCFLTYINASAFCWLKWVNGVCLNAFIPVRPRCCWFWTGPSGFVIQLVGCEKVRGQSVVMERVTAWRAGCLTRSDPAGRRDSTGLMPAVPAVFLLPRTDVYRVPRRCWRPVPPSPRWSGAALRGFPRRSHTELQSSSFQQNKQCLRAVDPHKTHTQLLNECIMNTLVSLRRLSLNLFAYTYTTVGPTVFLPQTY